MTPEQALMLQCVQKALNLCAANQSEAHITPEDIMEDAKYFYEKLQEFGLPEEFKKAIEEGQNEG